MKTKLKFTKDSYKNKYLQLGNELNKFHFDVYNNKIIISVYGLKRKNENMCVNGFHDIKEINCISLDDARIKIDAFMKSNESQFVYFDNNNFLIK